MLKRGASIAWSYDSDADVQQLGADGSYTVAAKTVTDEVLTVNQVPASTFRIPATQNIQDHRPTQQKWATKAMNRIFWWIDAQVLGALKAGAGSTIDDGDFSGTAGVPLTLSSSNASAIFTAARRKLRNQNVIYDENKKFTGYVKLDSISKYPAAAIPAELEEQVLLAVGFKPGDLGDTVLKAGYLNMLFGFNTFVSTALPFTFRLSQTATPTNSDTIVIGGTTLTFVTGSPTNAGDIKAETDAATSMTNLKNFLNAPYTEISGKNKPLVRANLTQADAFLFDLISSSAVAGTAPAIITVTILGQSLVSASVTGSGMVIDRQAVHAIFGVSQSIALVMQRTPELAVSSGQIIGNGTTGGILAQDFATWALIGWKMFKTHGPQIVDVAISTTGAVAPNNVYN